MHVQGELDSLLLLAPEIPNVPRPSHVAMAPMSFPANSKE